MGLPATYSSTRHIIKILRRVKKMKNAVDPLKFGCGIYMFYPSSCCVLPLPSPSLSPPTYLRLHYVQLLLELPPAKHSVWLL